MKVRKFPEKLGSVFLALPFVFMSHQLDAQRSELASALPWEAQGLGKDKELIDKRDRTSKHFTLPDGKTKMITTVGSLHYNESGIWKDIKTDILPNTTANHPTHAFASTQNQFKTYFPSKFRDGIITNVLKSDVKEHLNGFFFEDAMGSRLQDVQLNSNANASVNKNKIVYSNVAPSVDLAYTQSNDGRKFDLVLKNSNALSALPNAAKYVVIEEIVEIPSHWVVKKTENGIDVYEGTVWVMNFPTPIARETHKQGKNYEQDEDLLVEGSIEMQRVGNELVIYTRFPVAWLTDSKRNYPLYLDPIVSYFPNNTLMWTGRLTSTNGTKQSGFIRVAAATSLGWAKFNISTLPTGATITDADYYGYHYTTTGTPVKVTSLVGMQTVDPATALNTAIQSQHDNGPIYNTGFNFGDNIYQWRSGAINAAGRTAIAAQAAQTWTAFAIRYVSGSTTFMYHYGFEVTGGANAALMCYLELDYFTGPCTAPPTPGTVSGPTSICPNENFALSISGNTSGQGQTFQWQSSINGTTWTNIAGATNPNYTASITSDTYFRCVMTCSGQSANTPGIFVTVNNFYQCYCTSMPTNNTYGYINTFNFSNINYTSTIACQQYTNNTATPAVVFQGNTINFSSYINSCTGTTAYNMWYKIWIDFNQNGSFTDPGEEVYSGGGVYFQTVVGSIQIPQSALTGLTGMRVSMQESGNASLAPCASYSWGEVQDYLVDILPPPANDAGIASIDTPLAPACAVANAVWVTLDNMGTDTLQSATINWTVNGVAQTPVSWTGSVAPLNTSASPVFVGNYSFNIGDNLVVWTSNPNGVQDSVALNDTATFSIPQLALNGNYTINPSAGGATNYTSFSAALTALSTFGVCGPVVFDVSDGVYNEVLAINEVFGASTTNTITFRSLSGDTAACRIQTALTNATNQGVLSFFANASHYRFENFGIHNTTTSSYRNVVYVGSPNTIGNQFIGCRMQNVQINSTSTLYSIVYKVSNNRGDDWLFEDNDMINGSYGVYWWGGSTNYDNNNSFVNNRIHDSYYMGVYAYYQNTCVIDGNYIASAANYTSGRGIQAYYLDNGFSISNNVIPSISSNNHVWPYYGILLGYGTGSINNFGKVHGNVLSNRQAYYALYGTQNVFVEYANNSIYTERPGFSYAVFISGGAVNSFYNNIVDHQSTSGYAIYVSPASAIMNMDNNAYRSPINIGYWNANHATLASWQNASGMDANAVDIGTGPLFSDTTFLRVCDTRFDATGANIAGYTHDFEGDPVVTGAVDIGADQFMPLAEFGGTDTTAVCDGDTLMLTVDYFGNNVSWNNGAATGRTFEVTATGLYTASVTNSCGTATKDFIVMSQESATLPGTFNICADDSGTLDPQVSGGMYNWSTGANGATIVVNTPGAYSVTLTDKYGCESSASTTVTQSENVSLDDTTKFCEGGAATLESNVQGTYAWSNASTSSSIQVSSEGTYSVTVTDLNNCVSSASTEVVEILNPVADYTRLISFLTIQFTDNSQHATGWLWDFGDGTTSNDPNPLHIFPWPGGTFTVTLTVWNECDTVSISEEFTVNDEHNSVNELNDANSWKVYPNPTVDQINVMPLSKTQGETIISLYDLRGQLVIQRKMGEVISGQAIVLDVSNLAQGMYVLQLQNDISNQTHNVIVK